MNLYWLDLETTGLDPRKDQILEIAISKTTLEDPFYLGYVTHIILPAPPIAELDPFIVNMHTKNGLLEQCAKTHFTLAQAESHLLEMIPECKDRENMPTLAGSVVNFDHEFLAAHMPTLAARFSHRHYDVSAIKLFCRSLGMGKPPKAEAHRAVADVKESIEHAKLCSEWLSRHFRPFGDK